MRNDLNPANMTPNERFAELAGILARGVLRLHGNSSARKKLSESGQNPLDDPANSRLSVQRG